jgi:hypothetical protein
MDQGQNQAAGKNQSFPLLPEKRNNIIFRFFVENAVVFKSRITEYGKPMGTPPTFINKPLFIATQGKTFIIRGNKPQSLIKAV